jgi:hypothetical protein
MGATLLPCIPPLLVPHAPPKHSLLVDPEDLQYICDLGQGALSLVEKGRLQLADGKVRACACHRRRMRMRLSRLPPCGAF